MTACPSQPVPVLAYVVLIHRNDGTQRETAPFLDYAVAESLGRLWLLEDGVITYTVQTRLASHCDW